MNLFNLPNHIISKILLYEPNELQKRLVFFIKNNAINTIYLLRDNMLLRHIYKIGWMSDRLDLYECAVKNKLYEYVIFSLNTYDDSQYMMMMYNVIKYDYLKIFTMLVRNDACIDRFIEDVIVSNGSTKCLKHILSFGGICNEDKQRMIKILNRKNILNKNKMIKLLT